MKKEIIDYFNSISGKSVKTLTVVKKLSLLDGEVARLFLEKMKDEKGDAAGCFKICSLFKEQGFALLKSKKVYEKPDISRINRNNDVKLNLNNQLLNEGACITKYHSIFFADKRYIELQQLALGLPIAIIQDRTFANKLGMRLNDCYGEMFKYNLARQQEILKLPQKAFDDLFNTHLIFRKFNCRLYDCHCENLLVNKNGFTVVDVDYGELLEQQRFDKPKETDAYVSYFIKPFSFACHPMFTKEQTDELVKNNIKILQRLVKAVEHKNIEFNLEKQSLFVSAMMGGSIKKYEKALTPIFKK